MADLSEIIVGFLDALGRNPAYMFLFIGFIIMLIVAILALHFHSIRGQEIFVHGRQSARRRGARWKGR